MCSHGAAERPSLSDSSCVLVRRRIEAKVRGIRYGNFLVGGAN